MKRLKSMAKQKKIILSVLVVLVALCGVATGIVIQRMQKTAIVEELNKANITWYSEEEDSFTITTVKELYDLAKLSDFYDFKGQTIYLGADIVVNEGNAADWATQPPEKMWFPVQGFTGTFNGKGHTISGLYGVGVSAPMGLFSDTHSKCKIKDLRLVNCYFESNGSQAVGSISANGSGTFEKIYSDAIVAGNRNYIGGLIGRIDPGRESSILARVSKITNCWFDGEIHMISAKSRQGGGIVGGIKSGDVRIEHCLNSGNIYCASAEEAYQIGGMIGTVGDMTGKSVAKATVQLNDCLSVGNIGTEYKITAGTFIGYLLKGTSTTIKNSYVLKGALDTSGSISGGQNGTALEFEQEYLIGEEAYRWTSLDFSTYWSAMQGKTPELRCFTKSDVDLEGLERVFNLDWYDDDDTRSEYVLYTAEDLYGLQMLCNQNVTFADKTIKLGADIQVNEGKATDWAKGKNLPALKWTPIGGGEDKYRAFSGTFDGQGHTISGLYMSSDGLYLGLFGTLDLKGQSTIKNLRLTNSYFECTREEGLSNTLDGLGSIAGQGAGVLDTIYSDVILVNKTSRTGGLIGTHRQKSSPLTVMNCWYDGQITGVDWIGGIVGHVRDVTAYTNITDCLVTANMISTMTEGNSYIGGILGHSYIGTIDSCLVVGELKGVGNVGGIVGGCGSPTENPLVMRKCYDATNAEKIITIRAGRVLATMVQSLDKEELIGNKGYINTLLGFYSNGSNKDGRWIAINNGTPQLKSFAIGKAVKTSGLTRNNIETDISWYNAKKDKLTIKNVKQLYGLADLCNFGIDFKKKTIRLTTDIQVNEGNATDWAKGEHIPTYKWTPIGGGATSVDHLPFAGTFDGQGHTISGLYMQSDGLYLGLFGVLEKSGSSTIKNLRLTNSYFECNATEIVNASIEGLGSVVGQGAGVLDTIYSDVILVNQKRNTGGLVGTQCQKDSPLAITNCWYDGSVTGPEWIGGLIGFGREHVKYTNITDCLVTADLTSTLEKGNSNLGGLVSRVATGNINSCVVAGTIKGVGGGVGAFIGRNSTQVGQKLIISKCYNATNISKLHEAGNGQTYLLNLKTLSREDLLGDKGYINTLLSFHNLFSNANGRWVAVSNNIPQLKSFTRGETLNVKENNRILVESDISWYDASKKTYTISNAEQLYGLADLCNSGVDFAKKTIKLGANIEVNKGNASEWKNREDVSLCEWTPIGGGLDSGDATKVFAGTFDGQGHSISGLYMKSSGLYLGLFGVLATDGSSTIKNLKLTNTYFEASKTTQNSNYRDALGSIAGMGSGTIDTVYSDAILVSNVRIVGGLVGSERQKGASLTVTNCWYNGDITGTQWIGGIVGYVHKDAVARSEFIDCLVTADMTSTLETGDSYMGGISGQVLYGIIDSCVVVGELHGIGTVSSLIRHYTVVEGEKLDVNRCYYATNVEESVGGGSGDYTGTKIVEVDEESLKDTNAYTHTWLEFYGKDDNEDGRWVMQTDELLCLRSFAKSGYMDDLGSVANMVRPVVADTSWYDDTSLEFIIETAGELYGLAELCNAGNTFTGKTIKLGKDIIVNSGDAEEWAQGKNLPANEWITIGGGPTGLRTNEYFDGTFDGQGHTVSGLYMSSDGLYLGMFGVLDVNSVIKNFKLVNTYFECTRTTEQEMHRDGLGSIAGWGVGTLDTIYSDAILVNAESRTGGLVGNHRKGSTILSVTNCWFDGQITATDYIGGIIGYVRENITDTVVTDCLVTADLTSTMKSGDSYIGGICGLARYGTFSSCVVSGTLTGPGSVRGIIGRNITPSDQTLVVAKCYHVTNVENSCGTGSGIVESEVKKVSKDKLTGTNAFSNTLLDFYVKDKNEDGQWLAVSNGLPVLKSFVGEQKVEDVSTLSRKVEADTSWYDSAKTTFVICTPNELYGLAKLCNEGNTFVGKTIKLGTDIKVNTGLATDWEKGKNLPINKWVTIGGGPTGLRTNEYFDGTFDGQGHTVSGLYMSSEGLYLGMFGVLDVNSLIKNFKLTNTYFECTRTTEQQNQMDGLGSIAGWGVGTLDTIYSDAILVNAESRTGGMVGNHRKSNTTLSVNNCWFDGKITGDDFIGGIIGYVRDTTTSTVVKDCFVTADLTSTLSSGNSYVGGIVGRARFGEISSCVYIGTITGKSFVAGIAGRTYATETNPLKITKCYYATNVQEAYTYNSGSNAAPQMSNVDSVSRTDLQGVSAYTKTLLDFYDRNTAPTAKWVLIKDELICLRSFTKKTFIDDLSNLSR